MDNLIQKFYSNGKEEEQKYTQFGAFSNSLMKNSSTKLSFIKPNIGLINPAIHNVETASKNQVPKTPVKNNISDDAYLKPKKLIFNSSSDLFNQNNIPKNNFAYSTKNENGLDKESIPSLKTIKQDINTENKKNSTKMQMMEEKMKNLELKSQRLEVINDFFFDMFENNLVKEELKRQKGIKEEKENKEEEDDYFDQKIEEKKEYQKNKRNKKKKKDLMINPQLINDEEAYKKQFIEKTDKFSRKYLNTVKTDIGLALVEKQLQKNELLNNITEDILDLKGELMNKLEKLEMKQRAEMKTIAYCLQNSGDDNVENLANRLFGDDILKPDEEILNFNTDKNSMNTTTLKFTGSAFNANLFNTNNIQTRKKFNERRQSIDRRNSIERRQSINRRNSIERRQSINRRNSIERRQSIDTNNTNTNYEEKTTRIKFKDDDNKAPRKSIFYNKKNSNEIIIEENDDEN